MSDRVSEIKQRLAIPGVWYKGDSAAPGDIAYLVGEVERLQDEFHAILSEAKRWVPIREPIFMRIYRALVRLEVERVTPDSPATPKRAPGE